MLSLIHISLLVGGIQPSVADVVQDGAGEEVGILEHRPQGAAQVLLPNGPHVDAVIGDQAGVDLVKTVDQVGDGGLAAPVEPTKAIFWPGLA